MDTHSSGTVGEVGDGGCHLGTVSSSVISALSSQPAHSSQPGSFYHCLGASEAGLGQGSQGQISAGQQILVAVGKSSELETRKLLPSRAEELND